MFQDHGTSIITIAMPALFSIALICAPVHLIAQENNPFGGSSSGNTDPFGSPSKPASDPFGSENSNTAQPDQSESKKTVEKPAPNPELERIEKEKEKLKKTREETKAEINTLVQSLVGKLTDKQLAQIHKLCSQLLDAQSHAQLEQLDAELETEERIQAFDAEREHLRKQIYEMLDELDQLKSNTELSQKITGELDSTIAEVQKWFAHALRSSDQPVLQNWVLSRLKEFPEVTRQLTFSPSGSGQNGEMPQPVELEMALRELLKSTDSKLRQLSAEVLAIFDPYAESPQEISATSPWPIVAEPGREAEQKLLEKLSTINQIEFIEIPFNEFLEFLEDLHEITILTSEEMKTVVPDASELYLDFEAESISLRNLLEMVLTPRGLAYQVRGETLVITTIEDIAAHPSRRIYNLADHQLVKNGEGPDQLATLLKTAIESNTLQVMPMGRQLLVIGNESDHYEVARLLTLFHAGEDQ